MILLGLPWWRSGWESACQCGGSGFEPWSGRIPHAAEQLSACAATAEPALWSLRAAAAGPVHLESVLRSRRGHCSERPALAETGESPCTATKTQCRQKLKKKKIK